MALECRFDPGFIEEAVFLQMTHPGDNAGRQLTATFHQEREALYAEVEAAHREQVFEQLASRYFRLLGLETCVTERFEELPLVSAHIELAVIRRVWSRKDEQVELYAGLSAAPGACLPSLGERQAAQAGGTRASTQAPVSWEASRTVFLGLLPARVLERERFIAYLRHELMHIEDMLDPAFSYDPHPTLGGDGDIENNLIRERFRVLWDAWVHGRIQRQGWPTALPDEVRCRDVKRAFPFLVPDDRDALYVTACARERWTQQAMLAVARRTPAGVMG
jgi:hypothetical protein